MFLFFQKKGGGGAAVPPIQTAEVTDCIYLSIIRAVSRLWDPTVTPNAAGEQCLEKVCKQTVHRAHGAAP